jgi:hypothetical protein
MLSLPLGAACEATRTVPVSENAQAFYGWLHLIHRLNVDTTLDKEIYESWATAEADKEGEC